MKYFGTVLTESKPHDQGYHTMTLCAPEIADTAKPGQFVMIYLKDKQHLLPRPISIYDVNREKGLITLVYVVVRAGTKIMSRWPMWHSVGVMGPLGKGFNADFPKGEKIAIVGGGVGVAPLFFLTKELKECQVDVYLGFRDNAPEFASLFENAQISTKGLVTDLLPKDPEYAAILTCGPIPMLKAVADYAHLHNIPCQVSLEERMACGLGACKGCVVKTMIRYQLCCDDGPVFNSKEVNWDV